MTTSTANSTMTLLDTNFEPERILMNIRLLLFHD